MRNSSSFLSRSAPWPDPNSPILAGIDFGVPVVDLIRWLEARDLLCGENGRKQDVPAALAVARTSKHPDALWLSSLFAEDTSCSTANEARETFLSLPDDGRAVFFSWRLLDLRSRFVDQSLLERAVRLGCVPALVQMIKLKRVIDEELLLLEKVNESAKERDAFCEIGTRFQGSHHNGARCLRIAAELGLGEAASRLGFRYAELDPMRWLWLGRGALRGDGDKFGSNFVRHVFQYVSGGDGSAETVFAIGHALKGHVDTGKQEFFWSQR